MTLRRWFVENGPSEIYGRYLESDSLDEVKMNSRPLTLEFPRETSKDVVLTVVLGTALSKAVYARGAS
jgi:hypothetical protein